MIAIGIAAVLVAALGLQAFAGVVAPVFLALVLSITVQPLRRLPVRHGLPAWLGTALSLVAVYAIVAGLVLILVISGLQLAGLLDDYAPQFEAFLQDLGASCRAVGVSQGQVAAVQAALDPAKLIDALVALFGGVAGILSSVAFLVLLLFFTVTDAGTFASNLARVSPAGQRLAQAFQLFAHGSRQYLAVSTIFGAGVALLDVIALTILDIRYAWLWGLLAFITNYIPNVGFIIGLIPPTIIALLDHDAQTALAVVIIYCVLNIVIQSIIQPRVVGTTVGLSATSAFSPCSSGARSWAVLAHFSRSPPPLRQGPVRRRRPRPRMGDPVALQLRRDRASDPHPRRTGHIGLDRQQDEKLLLPLHRSPIGPRGR